MGFCSSEGVAPGKVNLYDNVQLIDPNLALRPLRRAMHIKEVRQRVPVLRLDTERLLRVVAAVMIEHVDNPTEPKIPQPETYFRPRVAHAATPSDISMSKPEIQLPPREVWPDLWALAGLVTERVATSFDLFTLFMPQGFEEATLFDDKPGITSRGMCQSKLHEAENLSSQHARKHSNSEPEAGASTAAIFSGEQPVNTSSLPSDVEDRQDTALQAQSGYDLSEDCYWDERIVTHWNKHNVPDGEWRDNMAMCVGELSALFNGLGRFAGAAEEDNAAKER